MEETLKTVIDQYLARGFGTMNKNGFEVWMFHYLMQHQLQGKSNYIQRACCLLKSYRSSQSNTLPYTYVTTVLQQSNGNNNYNCTRQ